MKHFGKQNQNTVHITTPLDAALEDASDRLRRGEHVPQSEDVQLKAAIIEHLAGITDALSLVAARLERFEKRQEEIEAELRAYKERHSDAQRMVAQKLEELDEIPDDVRRQAKARLADDLNRMMAYQKAEALTNGMETLIRAQDEGFVEFNWEYETTYFKFGDVAFVVRPGRNRIPKEFYGEVERNIQTRKRLEQQRNALLAERRYNRWDDVKDVILSS